MKKKGFTLAELLGVIIVIGLLALLILPAVDRSIDNSKNKAYEVQIKNLERVAEDWAMEHMGELPKKNGEFSYVYLGQLVYGGYVDDDIRDPRDGKKFPYDTQIKITRKNNGYVFEVVEGSGTEGFLGDVPTITLNGSSTVEVGLNGTYTELGATAITYSGKDVSKDIIISSTVDTTRVGTYYVTYKITHNGSTDEKTRKVIVKDMKPTITLNGASIVTIRLNEPYTDAGATAKTYDGIDISSSIVVTNNVDNTKVGIYYVRYNVSYNGKSAEEVIRKVQVIDKNPIIVLNPTETSKYQKSLTINVIATPYEGNTISTLVYKLNGGSEQTVDNNQITLNMDGTHTIEVIATDNEGIVGTITCGPYKIDTTPPTITFDEGDNAGITLKVSEVASYNLKAGVSVTDNNSITLDDVVVSGSLSAAAGEYTLTYTTTDIAGNTSSKTRKITVLETTEWTFTSDGTFTVPVTGIYTIEMHGGGGGGGGGAGMVGLKKTGGNGGGSGELFETTLTAGMEYAITIGLGGSGGRSDFATNLQAAGKEGTDGGITTFGDIFSVEGGKGGGKAIINHYGANYSGGAGTNGASVGSLASGKSGGATTGSYGNGGSGGSASSNSNTISGTNGQNGAVIVTLIE